MWNNSGDYEVNFSDGERKFRYYTFTPSPIYNNFVKIDDELTSLLSKANRLLGLLEGISMYGLT